MSQPARFTQFSAQRKFLVFNSVQIVQIVEKAHIKSDINPVLLPVRPWLPELKIIVKAARTTFSRAFKEWSLTRRPTRHL